MASSIVLEIYKQNHILTFSCGQQCKDLASICNCKSVQASRSCCGQQQLLIVERFVHKTLVERSKPEEGACHCPRKKVSYPFLLYLLYL